MRVDVSSIKGKTLRFSPGQTPRNLSSDLKASDEETNFRLPRLAVHCRQNANGYSKYMNDGNADEIATQIVRPDESYILSATSGLVNLSFPDKRSHNL